MSLKFSNFYNGGILKATDIVVGLRDGTNTKFDFPGDGLKDQYGNYFLKYLSSGQLSVNYISFTNALTGESVVIGPDGSDASIDLLIQSKEDGNLLFSVPGEGDATFTFEGDGNFNIINNGEGFFILNNTQGVNAISNDTTLANDDPRALITEHAVKTYVDEHAADINATFITKTDETASLPNSQPLSPLATGVMASTTGTGVVATRILTGTANQVNIANGNGSANPTFSISSTLVTPGTVELGGGTLNLNNYAIVSNNDQDITIRPGDGVLDWINLETNYVNVKSAFIFNSSVINNITYNSNSFYFNLNNTPVLNMSPSGLQISNAGARVTSISTDTTLSANVDTLLSTQKAIKTYVDTSDISIKSGTYITNTNETALLPNSQPLSPLATGVMASTAGTGIVATRILTGTSNQINISNGNGSANPTFSLSSTLVTPGSITLGGDLDVGTSLITSQSGRPVIIAPSNTNDPIEFESTYVYLDQYLGHLGETTNNIQFTSGSQTYNIGGSSVMDITSSGFRLGGANARITGISNSAAETSATLGMTANAIQMAIANQIGSAKSFRGGYNASTNLFPSTGGSGTAGAILAGDVWVITTGGTLGGTVVSSGDTLIALVDTPGQTSANWAINANGVATWNGRAGVVTPLSGDYSFSLISGTAAVTQGGTGATSVGASGTLAQSNGSIYGFTTATYPSTISANELLYGSGTNVVSALATDLSAALTTDEFGALRWTNLGLGQVLMGSFTSGAVAGTINAGTGLGASFGVGSITLALSVPVSIANGGTNTTSAIGASGTLAQSDGSKYTFTTATYPATAGTAGNVLTSNGTNFVSSAPAYVPMPYNLVTASTQALAINNAYYTTYAGLSVMTLPSTAAVGSIIRVRAGSSGNTFKIAQNASQLIYYGAQNGVSVVTTTGTGGYLQSVDPNTTVDLECIVADTTWIVVSNVNSLTVV